MTQYFITHSSYTGEIKVVYNQDKLLDGFDCSSTNLSERRRAIFKEVIPVRIEDLEGIKEVIKGCHIIAEELEISFDMFWNKYDKKINRKRCEPLWRKLSKAKQYAAYNGIAAYNRYLHSTGFRGKQDPDNYLRNETWTSEF